jgi:hypothetical protein
MRSRPCKLEALLIALLQAAACGGGAAAGKSTTPATASPPPLPEDPLALVPTGSHMLARLDFDAARASPHFAVLQDWASRFVCLGAPGSKALIVHTHAAIALGLDPVPPEQRPQGVALLSGTFSDEDTREALGELCSYAGAHCETPVARTAGRFGVLGAGGLAAARLGEHMLAMGDESGVAAVLAVADGNRAAEPLTGTLVPGLDTRHWLTQHTLAIVARVDDRAASRISRELESVGGAVLADGLSNGAAAFGLMLAKDASAEARVAYAEPGAADRSAAGLRSLVGQAGFVMRLMGMPPLLEHLRVDVQAGILRLGIRLSPDDVRDLRDRLAPMFEGRPPVCSEKLASLAPGNRL